jgi:phage shock protein C
VAGGIAQSLNTDSSLIRILFILLAIFAGGGVLLYLILWIALPEEEYPYFQQPGSQSSSNPAGEGSTLNENQEPFVGSRPRQDGGLIAGLIMIVVGAVFLIARFLPRFHFGDLWPIILVAAGAVLIFSSFQPKK